MLSPDGGRIAHWWRDDSGGGVRVLDLSTGRWIDQSTPDLAVSGLTWSADGRWLTYATYPDEEWIGAAWQGPLDWHWRRWDTGSRADQVWPLAVAGVEEVALLDDGQQLAWVAGRHRLAVAGVDGTRLEPLTGAGPTVRLEPRVRARWWSVATGLLGQPTRAVFLHRRGARNRDQVLGRLAFSYSPWPSLVPLSRERRRLTRRRCSRPSRT